MSAHGAQRLWKLPFSRKEMRAMLAAMAGEAALPGARVELLILTDRDMEALHRQSFERPGPTNVLSFPLAGAPGPRPGQSLPPGGPSDSSGQPPSLLGSLALSVDTLARESFLYGQPPASYCVRLLAHGFAHLLGFEHGADMEGLCRRLEQAALSVLE
ncbi:rRNA maturation RNase YbeY [Desulfovibrio sp. OttesenSCG-928-G11]|nr:rRNA maturation RNase YbeY [Desulfovibrio sp. OttesenSCG-928-G11]